MTSIARALAVALVFSCVAGLAGRAEATTFAGWHDPARNGDFVIRPL